MHPIRSLALTAAIVSALFTGPAAAQRASLGERVSALEQRAAGNQGNVDLLNQVNQLKTEVATLRAQLEELQQKGEQAQASSRAQYLDVDGRLNRLEGGASATGTPAGTASAPPAPSSAAVPAAPDASSERGGTYGDPGALAQMGASAGTTAGTDERASYEAAFDVLKAGRYDESARLFAQFLQAHPDGSYAPNARYWLGESYYVTQNYALALEQFQTLYARYPTHDKAPGALLKVGLSQYGLKQIDEAQATLAQVAQKYPGTDAARTADDRLRAIELTR